MSKKTQIQKFRDTAREIGADERDESFSTALKKIAKVKQSKAVPKRKPKLGGSKRG